MPQFIKTMFDNLIMGAMPICSPEQPKELHYKGCFDHNMIPLVYIPLENLENHAELTAGMVRAQTPSAEGIIMTVSYLEPYW